jgi:hypothetical protein
MTEEFAKFLNELSTWLSRQHGMIAKDYAKELAKYLINENDNKK